MVEELENDFARIIAYTGRTPMFEGEGTYEAGSSSTYHEDLVAASAIFLPHAIKRVLEWPSASSIFPKDVLEISVKETDVKGVYALDDIELTKFSKYSLGLALSYLVDQVTGQSPDGVIDLGILTKSMAPGWASRLTEVIKNERASESILAGSVYPGPGGG
jgi:hypothetical protein